MLRANMLRAELSLVCLDHYAFSLSFPPPSPFLLSIFHQSFHQSFLPSQAENEERIKLLLLKQKVIPEMYQSGF